ncbi:hypothetical protein GCM10022206_76530 [Streptomyces chiangmaiensis]
MRLGTVDEAYEFFEGPETGRAEVVQAHTWRPDGTGEQGIRDEDMAMYGAIARAP